MQNRIIYLNNEKSSKIGFSKQRNISGNKVNLYDFNDEAEEDISKTIKEFQKRKLRLNRIVFYSKKKRRKINRTIELALHLDLIKIQFYKIFDLNLFKEFYTKYGITPIEYLDFNKTIIFQIENEDLFENFKIHIEIVINSQKNTSYKNEEFNLIALIYKFEFFDSRSRIFTYNGKGILLSLISTYLEKHYFTQKNSLFNFLQIQNIQYNYKDNCPDIIEIKELDENTIQLLADNFDIVKSITSSRTEKIRPSIAGPIREYGFDVEIPNNITTVGIIDTGITKISPLENLILNDNFNHTSLPPFWDEVGHGTLVSGLVAFGNDFYTEKKAVYQAKAKLFNIKALHFSNDNLDIPQLIEDVKNAKRDYGIRIFNMSLVIPNAKKYNATYSQFAYELDKLAFQEDILIFLAVGNFDSESLNTLKNEYPHPDHDYPDFFYNLNSDSDSHNCEDTNICVPSESLNNISVGALAGNLEEIDKSDITPVDFYPAYYTRKFHLDYNQTINGSEIKQKNNFLNKPDFVMEGGDLFQYRSGIQILRSPIADSEKFYGRTCGTSLATPLVTSYAAETLNYYPNIKTQSVKALLINSASYYDSNKLEHFKNQPSHLLKSLVGFGKPKKNQLLLTDKNSIQYLVEDKIKVNEIFKIPIFLPNYLLTNGNKLQFDIALAYSFLPIKDNHLNYLPLHISFNIVRDIDIKEIAKKQENYGIKNQFSWSEDHFGIDNRLFSNAQKKTYRLQPKDLISCDGSIALAVRCLAKNEFKDDLIKNKHSFSITIRITELISNENNSGIDLYSEMMEINNFLDISDEIELDTNLEADLEI